MTDHSEQVFMQSKWEYRKTTSEYPGEKAVWNSCNLIIKKIKFNGYRNIKPKKARATLCINKHWQP